MVCTNFNEINEKKLKKADIIVFSPGPGAPKDYPVSSQFIKNTKVIKKLLEFVLGFNKFCTVKMEK